MKMRIIAVLTLIALGIFPCAVAEQQVPDSFPPQRIEMEAFTFNLDYYWMTKELTLQDAENGLLFQADSADGTQSLMVFANGEGDYDTIYELTARDEYSKVATRQGAQTYNSIEIVFTASDEQHSANAYISLNGNAYAFVLRNVGEDESAEEQSAPVEKLQSILLSLTAKE